MSVWLQADGEEGTAASGDVVLTPAGSVVRIAEVGADGAPSVRAEVAPKLLPGLPDAGDGPVEITDEALLRAVRGVLSADRERGG